MAPDENDPVPLRSLIALWDKHSDRPWKVSGARSATNIAMINAYVSHTVNLGRAVLLLHGERMHFEQIPLVRSSMESAVTAAWLAVFPERTPDLARHSSSERRKVIQEMLDHGSIVDGAEARLEEIDEFLADYEGIPHAEGRWLKTRFAALNGGKSLYAMYRALCAWDHATNSLADAYTGTTEITETNPWGLILHGRANG